MGQEAVRQGILSVNARGFGFVSSVGFDDDLYVSEERLAGAMHGDLVDARLVSRSRRGSEGEVVRVVNRANNKVPGVLRRRGKAQWLEPDDARVRGPIVLFPSADSKGIVQGEDGAAVARITRFPEMPRDPGGRARRRPRSLRSQRRSREDPIREEITDTRPKRCVRPKRSGEKWRKKS
jgi:ribonuclease R